MKEMNSGSVDLIATDPPFNSNQFYQSTPDVVTGKVHSFDDRWAWDDDIHPEWIDAMQDEVAIWSVIDSSIQSHGKGMAAFLIYMAVRLVEMHRILKPTGSLYLHCDQTAVHYLKALLDAIFGAENFRNDLIWKRTNAPTASDNKFGTVHDNILFYAKSDQTKMNPVFIPYTNEYIKQTYSRKDDRGRFQSSPLTAKGSSNGPSGKPWKGVDVSAKGLHWVCPTALPDDLEFPDNWKNMITQDKLDWLDQNDMIYNPPNGKVPRFKRYLSTSEGIRASDLIVDVKPVMGGAHENTEYPTQKPVKLYERIVKASSNPGEVVLDPFCGCATTLEAAENQGRQWVGIDLWEGAYDEVTKRMREKLNLAEKGIPAEGDGILSFGTVQFLTDPPKREDDDDGDFPNTPEITAIRHYSLPKAPWQKLQKDEIRKHLADAQNLTGEDEEGFVTCAGCGRSLEQRFMHLDHINPRSSLGTNFIDNRLLLCGPCNQDKSNTLTMPGLRAKIIKDGWIHDEKRAERAVQAVANKVTQVISQNS